MDQLLADENKKLKLTLEEKSRMLDKQTEIINRQIDAIADAETQIQQLTAENTVLKAFRNRVRNSIIYRFSKWFRP